MEQAAEVVGVDLDPALLREPCHQLPRRPGPRIGVEQRLQGVEVGRRHGRRTTGAGVVGQGSEARDQERLDVLADRLLVRAEVAGDAGDRPPGVGEANHLQAVAGARGDAGVAGASAQLLVLGRGQGNADHGGAPPRPPFYDLLTATCLEGV